MAVKSVSALIAVALAALIPAGAATLDVDKGRSRIHVDVSATGHDFTGTLKDYTAKGSGDKGSLDPSGFELQWSFKNLKTGDAKRDKEMIKWLGGGDPKGTFKFTKSWKEKSGVTKAMGTITIHGVSKTISFPFTAKADGDWVTIDGTATLNYKDFKLDIIRSMGILTVDPKLAIRFHVVGKAK